MKYLSVIWLSIRMLVIAAILLASVFIALPWLLAGIKPYMGILKNLDDVCGSVFFLSFERTVSGILGEGQHKKIAGYVFWASVVDTLFFKLKIDKERHCFFNYLLEDKLNELRISVVRKRDELIKYAGGR